MESSTGKRCGQSLGQGADLAGPLWTLPGGEVRLAETFNARYRIDGGRRPPSWAPTAVFDDGRRTFLVLPVSARTGSAPALFALAADGGRQMTGYRQANGMLVMDGLLDRAELRMEGQARGVKVERLAEDRP